MKSYRKSGVVIVGQGAIAECLSENLLTENIEFHFFTRETQKNISFKRFLRQHKPRAVFITISTKDKGEAALDYIAICIMLGIPVITCEKGALAYHADVLRPHFGSIGYSASVGGGTMLLKYLKNRRLDDKEVEIHAVLNGTLNFIFDEIGHGGRSIGEACEEAIKLGYAEPGAKDPLSLINGELNDVRLKACVLFNTILSKGNVVEPDRIGSLKLTEAEINSLSEDGGNYRLIISFTNRGTPKEYPHLGPQFSFYAGGKWYISGAFRKINAPSQYSSWLPGGIGNAVHIIEGNLGRGGKYTLSGPGAGHEPTVSAMFADFQELCH